MLEVVLKLLAVLAFVLANGFFVACEFSLVAVRRSRVDQLIAEGHPLAPPLKRAVQHLDTYLAATQLGITIASIGLGWIGEPILAALIEPAFRFLPETLTVVSSHGIAIAIAFGLITALHIVLGELAPKSLALQQPERTALVVGRPLELFLFLFRPVIFLLNGLGNLVLRVLGLESGAGHELVHSVRELELLIEASQTAGVLEAQEEEMLHGVFGFADHLARELMIPRPDIVGVPEDATVADFLAIYREAPRARFPLYRESLDEITGILSIKDVLMAMAEGRVPAGDQSSAPIRPLGREPYFVPETKRIGELFTEMQARNIQMAVVVDEYGGTAGIITIEQMVEEIVGVVGDELEKPEPPILRHDERTVEVDASLRIDEVNEELGLGLPAGEYETIAGFVMDRLGRIPKENEQIAFENLQIRVTQMDGVKIEKVQITRLGGGTLGDGIAG